MKHLLTSIILLSTPLLFSQQITNFGLFQQNISFYNPSSTAYQTNHFATIQYKENLVGFPGNPTTFIAQYEKDLEKINSGIGMLMYNDKIGFSKHKVGMIQYRYSIKTGEESKLLFGASAGVFHTKYGDLLTFDNGPDTLKGSSQGKFTMNLGASYEWKKLYAGVSVMNVTKPVFDRLNYTASIHYVAHANYIFEFSDRFNISPQAKLITDLVKMSASLNLRFEHFNRFWYLAGTRNFKSLMFGAGIQFWDRLYLGYLYQHFQTSPGNTYPSHEAFVTFKINN